METKRVLLVEGRDDKFVAGKFCERLHFDLTVDIKTTSGKDPLLEVLPVELKEDISVLGVILDADTSLQASWRSVADCLRKAGYLNVPNMPDEKGTILPPPPDDSRQLPKFGIWVMPDNRMPGILEDFLKFLVPDGDTLLAHAEQVLDELPDKRFTDVGRPKSLMHTWLAWQKEPGKPYGQAISARYLDTDLPLGHTFSEWLKNLFSDESSDQQPDKFGMHLVRKLPPAASEPSG